MFLLSDILTYYCLLSHILLYTLKIHDVLRSRLVGWYLFQAPIVAKLSPLSIFEIGIGSIDVRHLILLAYWGNLLLWGCWLVPILSQRLFSLMFLLRLIVAELSTFPLFKIRVTSINMLHVMCLINRGRAVHFLPTFVN